MNVDGTKACISLAKRSAEDAVNAVCTNRTDVRSGTHSAKRSVGSLWARKRKEVAGLLNRKDLCKPHAGTQQQMSRRLHVIASPWETSSGFDYVLSLFVL